MLFASRLSSNIPLLLIGALGIGFATVLAANYQLRIVSTLIVISASLSLLAGIAEQLSINQRHLSELHRNPAPEIAAGIFISVGAFFKYLFLFFRLEPNFQHRRPSYLKTTQFSSTISSRSHWNRGNLIRKVYLILSLVVIVLIAILEASWRTAFALRSQSFASLSRGSASLQIIFLIWASIKIVFLATRYSSPDATVISTLKDLGSLVTGNAIGLANQILSLETMGFLESPVGRLLELYQMYLYLFDASFYCTRIASMNSVGFVRQ
ncbi:hypothetical protein BY996DRAFT_486014 [Phakopsora pachyrhizi]|nr:hypothetical protein BY996DRAFT_486014 [Phakopsora pachyrhizi]